MSEVLESNKLNKKDTSKTYNQYKDFEGRKYTGMKVGRCHKWYYDRGEWKEKKITPDKGNSVTLLLKGEQDTLQKDQVYQ